ncbi:MAG: hypothetical protein Q9170_006042 [Blastenia crenularia]
MSSSVLCSSRTNTQTTVLRRLSRGYCRGKRYRLSCDTYPKTLRYLDDAQRSTPSDAGWWLYSKSGQKLGSRPYLSQPHQGWRSSSSWARWKSQWDDFEQKHRIKDKGDGEDSAALFRTFGRLEKDSEELYQLLRKRIEADPFDALFGRRLLYPNRAACSNSDDTSGDRKKGQPKPGPESKPHQAAKANGERYQEEGHIRAASSDLASQRKSPSSDCGVESQAFIIDPITMRKVPLHPAKKAPEASPPKEDDNLSFNIQIKRFKGSNPQQPRDKLSKEKAATASGPASTHASDTNTGEIRETITPGWLSQEGFIPKEDINPTVEAKEAQQSGIPPPALSNSAAQAHPKRPPAPIAADARPGLSYEPKENKTDDVDLLRASDIRASSGLAGRPKKESILEKQKRRQGLEARYEAISLSERTWQEELAYEREQARMAKARKRDEVYKAYFEKEKLVHKAAMEAMEMRGAEAPTTTVPNAEAHPEQAEGDMATNVHEFASRERWYKREAPHATQLAKQKAIQAAKDKSFVQEIRGIYEDAYGTIDTKHRQPGTPTSHAGEQKPAVTTTPAAIPKQNKDVKESARSLLPSRGPLSMQERVGTMLQQLLDDSLHMQKLLRNPDASPEMREKLFHSNRSIRNASDGIVEALSSSPKPEKQSPVQAVTPGGQTTTSKMQNMAKAELPSTDIQKPSTVYSVLAYDPSSQQVTSAEMSSPSDSPSERRLSLSEALSSLTEPAKFLPHLTSLQSHGYEIVSSDTNILVLRKIHKTPPPMPRSSSLTAEKSSEGKEERRMNINPIDGTTTQTGNFASPTGFVSHDSALPPSALLESQESENTEQSPSGYKVRRKEDVFSGPSGKRWGNGRFDKTSDIMKRKARYRRSSRRRKTTKRMFGVGLWTAVCCYAVGRITEYWRA